MSDEEGRIIATIDPPKPRSKALKRVPQRSRIEGFQGPFTGCRYLDTAQGPGACGSILYYVTTVVRQLLRILGTAIILAKYRPHEIDLLVSGGSCSLG